VADRPEESYDTIVRLRRCHVSLCIATTSLADGGFYADVLPRSLPGVR